MLKLKLIFLLFILFAVTDPVFIPTVLVKGSTPNTVTIGWNLPNITDYYHYYNVSIRGRTGHTFFMKAGDNPEYLVEQGLKPGMNYSFRVSLINLYIINIASILF